MNHKTCIHAVTERSTHVVFLPYKHISQNLKKHRKNFTSIKTLTGDCKDIEFTLKREERLWSGVMLGLIYSRSFQSLREGQSQHKTEHRTIYYKEPP